MAFLATQRLSSADWKGKQRVFVALQTAQAQPTSTKNQLSNSAEFALLGGGLNCDNPLEQNQILLDNGRGRKTE